MSKKEKEEKKFNIKASLQTKTVKYGAYSSALTAVAVVAAVAVNLVFSYVLDDKVTFDLSPEKLYSIGGQTKEFLNNLEDDVTITVLANEENSDSTINQLLEMYKGESGHINVKYVDPTVDIGAANAYSGLAANSLVVACGTKETTVDINDIYVYDYYSYYTTGEMSFDGEGRITSAIDYVTSDDLPMLYSIVGHGESSMSATVSSLVSKQNIQTADLNLMTGSGIPEDCDCILICAPDKDYTAEEAQAVIDYLDNGGSVMVLSYYTENEMPNFKSILSAYGIELKDGIVMETASNAYQYPMYIIPDIESTDITNDLVEEKANILMLNAQGLTLAADAEAEVTALLSSSNGAYSKPIPEDGILSTYEKEDGDIEGPFAYAYLAEKEVKTENPAETGSSDEAEAADTADTGKLIVISSATLIDDAVTQGSALGNLDFYMNCLNYMTEGEGTESSISIEAKSITAQYMTVPMSQATLLMFVMIILIPGVVLVGGLVVWLKRRKR